MWLVLRKDADDVVFAEEAKTVKALTKILNEKYNYKAIRTILVLNCDECGSSGLFKSNKKGR